MTIVEKTVEWGINDGNYDYVEVKFKAEPRVENDGIGSYEYWGYKGFDKGNNYPVADEITWDENEFSPEVNDKIREWLDDDKNYESVESSIYEEFSKKIFPWD